MITVWARRRSAPLVVAAVAIVLAVVFLALWNGIDPTGASGWYVPGDLRGTVLATSNALHGHFGAVYSPTTGLVTLPGILVLLAPGVWLAEVIHPALAQPAHLFAAGGAGWLPVELLSLLSLAALLLAADALAEQQGVSRPRRWLLAAVEAGAGWTVVVWWGHPEDVVAVALLLGSVTMALRDRWKGTAWLLGAAIAVQPVVLLVAGVLAARMAPATMRRFTLRVAVLPAGLLAPVVLANWRGALHTLSQQPNFPTVDHPAPWGAWTLVAPGIGHQVLAAGPLRLAAVLVAVEGGLWLGRRHPLSASGLLWAVAGCLALRVLVEPVLVGYYVWPALAMALVGAAAKPRSWRLWTCGLVAVFAGVFGAASWVGNSSWWPIELACTLAGLALAASWPPMRGARESATGEDLARSRRVRITEQALT